MTEIIDENDSAAEINARAFARTAKFYAATDDDEVPALSVADVLVSVYVDRVTGVLRVHVDTSAGDEIPADADGVPHIVIELNEGAVWVNAPGHCGRCGRRDGEAPGPDCWSDPTGHPQPLNATH